MEAVRWFRCQGDIRTERSYQYPGGYKTATREASQSVIFLDVGTGGSKWKRFVGNRLCGLVVRVLAYISGGPVLYSRRYHIFREVVCLERGPLSLMRITEELLE
jgi:hypothetical protein